MTNFERRCSTSGFNGSVQKVSDTVKLKGIQYNTIYIKKLIKRHYITKNVIRSRWGDT